MASQTSHEKGLQRFGEGARSGLLMQQQAQQAGWHRASRATQRQPALAQLT